MYLLLQTLLNGTLVGAGYALIAVGLTLVFGILGIVNFAHGAYFALGAYITLMAQKLGLPYMLAVAASLVMVALVALVTEFFIIRRGLYVKDSQSSLIVTFALAQAMMSIMLLLAGPNPQSISTPFSSGSLSVFGLLLTRQRLVILIASAAVLGALGWWLKFSVRGQQVTAVAQNPKGALYAGINVPRIRTLSFVIGVCAASVAGSLTAPITNVFPTMGNASLVTSFIVVILGGLGSISGSLLGALLMGIAQALFETYVSASWTPALGWALVIVILFVAPQGLRGRSLKHRY